MSGETGPSTPNRRLGIALLALSVAAAGYNILTSLGLSAHDEALARADDPTLESVISEDEFLTHDLYYVYALLNEVARGAKLVAPSPETLDTHLIGSALITIPDMELAWVDYDATDIPNITGADVEHWIDVYKRRPSDELRVFHLILFEAGEPDVLRLYHDEEGLTLVDERLLDEEAA